MRHRPATLLYRATDLFEAALIHEALQANGIEVLSSGGETIASHTGIRFEASHVEIWVPSACAGEARHVVEACLERKAAGAGGGHGWNCRVCGQSNEAGFDLCWSCSAARVA